MGTRIIAVLAGVLMLAAACGDGGTAGSGGGMTLTIVEPAADSTVTTPFTVRVQSSVPLGPTSSGQHHIHVWFDGNEAQYQVVEADNVEIPSGALSPGQHVIHASLRNANHSAAGVEAEVTVTTTGGGAPGATPSPSSTGGYGY
jgi:hypothetical protein